MIETLLWAAVCHSSLKKDHIKLIIGSLQSESKELMAVVQEQQALVDQLLENNRIMQRE